MKAKLLGIFLLFIITSSVQAQDSLATVYFYMLGNTTGPMVSYQVMDKDAPVGILSAGVFLSHRCKVGESTFRTSISTNESKITLTMHPGMSYFVECSASREGAVYVPNFNEVSYEKARKDLNSIGSAQKLGDSLMRGYKTKLDSINDDVFASIPLRRSTIKSLKAYLLGDSICVSFYEVHSQGTTCRSFLIFPDGSTRELALSELRNNDLFGVIDYGDSVYCYYLEKIKKSTVLKAVVFSKKTQAKKIAPQYVVMTDKLLGSFFDKDLFLMYRDAKNQTIKLLQMHKFDTIISKEFILPRKFFYKDLSSVPIIFDDYPVRPSEAIKPVKIYVTEKELIVSIDSYDQPASVREAPSELPKGTTIYRIDRLTFKISSLSIPESSNRIFSTYIFQDYLYKIKKNYGFEISIFDSVKMVRSFSINKESSFKDKMAYVRDGISKRVLNHRNVWDAISNTGNAFISVEEIDSVLVLKVGTNKEIISSSVPFITGGGPVLAFASLTIAGLTSTTDENGVDHYFYLKGNPGNGFTYTNSSGSIDQAINLREINSLYRSHNYKHKSYLKRKNSTYAFYIMENSNELIVKKFTN